MEEKSYIDGYNQGYRLNKYSPELYEKLAESLDPDNEFEGGPIAGAEEAVRERERERMKQLESLQETRDAELENESEQEDEMER